MKISSRSVRWSLSSINRKKKNFMSRNWGCFSIETNIDVRHVSDFPITYTISFVSSLHSVMETISFKYKVPILKLLINDWSPSIFRLNVWIQRRKKNRSNSPAPDDQNSVFYHRIFLWIKTKKPTAWTSNNSLVESSNDDFWRNRCGDNSTAPNATNRYKHPINNMIVHNTAARFDSQQ